MRKFAILNWLFLAAILLTGCGGGGGGGGGSSSISPTAITTQPVSVTVYETQAATFAVYASGTSLTYQWARNGTSIPGATASSYTTPVTALADNGASYTVAVTGIAGSAASTAALLTVQSGAPVIASQPTSQSVVAGQSATFTVTTTGLPPFTYQWKKNGTDIAGATSSGYTTPTIIPGDNGNQYAVTVDNSLGSATSNAASLTVITQAVNHLVISEVASCYSYYVNCWFEIHNPTAAAIDLGTYQIKSTGLNTGTSATISSSTFSLPALIIPADGYVVVSGNYYSVAQHGTQLARIRTISNEIPYWTNNGFIELLGGGTTVDFVRWGTSVQAPTTAGQWSGAAVAAMPSSSSDYGKSIVRPYPASATTDTNMASDWIQVNWVTPAGRNDVPAGTLDADNDGIPDSAEVAGGTFAGLDLYAMGARTGRRDIFVEVDRMSSADPGVIPRSESLQKVVDAFAARNIAVHFDAGTQFSAGFSATAFNLGQGSNVVPFEPCVTMDQFTCTANTSGRRSLYDWKDDFLDLRRRVVFHYLLFGSSQLANGASGSGGLGEAPGNDLLITMGNWGMATTPASELNQLINMQASTVMHELGHNLGLRHGGDENLNYKPNYWSVMNYLYSLYGLDANPSGGTAYLRWRYEFYNTPSLCGLPNSPCGIPSQFILDYSDGSGSNLNENSLLESTNIGRGSTSGAFADWDQSSALTGTLLSINLRGDGMAKAVLHDYNDWGNLMLPFARASDVASGRSLATGVRISVPAAVPNPLVSDRQPHADEPHPSATFFERIHRAH